MLKHSFLLNNGCAHVNSIDFHGDLFSYLTICFTLCIYIYIDGCLDAVCFKSVCKYILGQPAMIFKIGGNDYEHTVYFVCSFLIFIFRLVFACLGVGSVLYKYSQSISVRGLLVYYKVYVIYNCYIT